MFKVFQRASILPELQEELGIPAGHTLKYTMLLVNRLSDIAGQYKAGMYRSTENEV